MSVSRRLDQIEQAALRVVPTDVGKWAVASGNPSAADAVVIAPADLHWLLTMVRATHVTPPAAKDAGQCSGSIPVEHTLGALPDHCSTCAEYDGPRRRTEAEARRCSQEGCPGDGRYQPPGKGHMPDCQHNAVAWVWETVTPPAEINAATLTDKEIELREWLRSQPGGAERWTVVKAGFRRSYDMGLRDAQTSATPPAEEGRADV